jgi:hypothetical protein
MKMRVLIAVLALVATPVIASVAQDRGSTPPASASVRQNCTHDKENAQRWQVGSHLGEKNADKNCESSGGTSGGGTSSTGTATISGFVFYDPQKTGVYTAGMAGILGVSVQLTGAGVSITQAAQWDGSFSIQQVLPAGTYQLCSVHSTMWTQSLPANNGCYTVTLGGTTWSVNNGLYFGLWF